MKMQLFQKVRYENQRWPLWRWDLNLRYIGKSFLHRQEPWSSTDQVYYERNFSYLASRPWERFESTDLILSAVGDLMWIRSGWKSFMSEKLSQKLARGHLTIANLETPIVRDRPVPKYVYETLRYNSDEGYLEPWRRLGNQNVFSIVNNHALDMELDGISKTRDSILKHPSFHCLGGYNLNDASIQIELQKVKIACLSLTFGINFWDSKSSNPISGIPVYSFGNTSRDPDWEKIREWIREVESKNDLVILVAHWGFEYEYWPDSLMRAHAHRLIELGVDVILGSSPHVLQPVEVVSINNFDSTCPVQLKQKGSCPRLGVIAYSLGNFATIMPTLACQTGAVLELGFQRQDNGDVHLSRLCAYPTVSFRGLGQTWIDGKTVLADELVSKGKRRKMHLEHSKRILGSIVQ